MVKTRAEIQKAYRQRLKEKNVELYLSRERARRMANYIPSKQLSSKNRSERNEKNRDYLKHYRKEKKELAKRLQNDMNANINQAEPMNTSGYESAPSDNQNRLLVRLNFHNRANGPRMRVSNELKKAKISMKVLKEKNEELKRKYRSTVRTMQRMKRKASASPRTPRSKATKLMKGMNLTPEQETSVRKELVFANVVCVEIKLSGHKSTVQYIKRGYYRI